MNYTLTATCHFGCESVLKREIRDLGLEIVRVTDGRVEFLASDDEVFLSNLWLRTAERVHINFLQFKATTFEELYQGIYEFDWTDILDANSNFIINGRSFNSKLFSISDCQRITEKAIIDRLRGKYKVDYFSKMGERYDFEISLLNDIATLYLNTSGVGLHKRGYRRKQGTAPIKETLASAMVSLSVWNKERPLYDPFCGSGTILIEAGMIARNIAPGIGRKFDCEHFSFLDSSKWKELRKEARDKIDFDTKLNISGSDYDRNMIMLARENTANMKLSDIFLFTKEVRKVEIDEEYGVIITNPPYGKRLEDDTIDRTYENFKSLIDTIPTWSYYVITDYEPLEKVLGRKADKNRKFYNGKIKTHYSYFLGPRPPRDYYEKV